MKSTKIKECWAFCLFFTKQACCIVSLENTALFPAAQLSNVSDLSDRFSTRGRSNPT